ncbi:TolC family protein [Thiomicrorhabdus sp. Milos-T2]|uniref:TolC family protein n=1 Tax=Thiomicrorhabdus sp. Milos-T2 TaxID=90814 RepID=UPI000493E590|nr:TolC family protein [Thiomicrorhabdus sp. Milos-T2]
MKINRPFAKKHGLPIVFLVSLLSGCTTYQAKPLNDDITLPQVVTLLKGSDDKNVSSSLNLDAYQVATIVLLNNRDLKLKRTQLYVSEAQLINAKLFADPQLSANFDQPTSSGSGLVNAWGVGLSYDVMSLLTHNTQVKSAKYQVKQAKLELEWQEWQAVQQSRILFLKSFSELQKLNLLADSLKLYQQRYQRSEKAMNQGNATLETVSTDLTSLVDLTSQINQISQIHTQTQQALSELMGLDSRIIVNLTPPNSSKPIDLQALEVALKKLPSKRPDLLALKAGYQSQEMKVSQAVLNQFPSINIGFNHASDTGSVLTNGLSMSINLPIFNGNKGVIAQQRATREQLRMAYDNRLKQSANQVHNLMKKRGLLNKRLTSLNLYLPKLQTLVNQAKPAYNDGNLDALVYINLENSWIQKQLERLNIQEQISLNEIALDTLLAIPFKNTSGENK